MALRDPGAPRRNPLFTVDDTIGAGDVETGGPDVETGGPDHGGPGDGWPDDGWSDDGWSDDGWSDDGWSGDPLLGAPGGAVGPLLGALTEAGPEAAEHLVNAAHELTLAVKVVVDAFERTLADQRAAFANENAGPESQATERRPREPRVQNIDVE